MADLAAVIVTRGRDAFGPWRMTVTDFPGGITDCSSCGQRVQSVLIYHKLKLPDELSVEATLLKRTRAPLGVSCGCYAKFIRQVVHITDSIQRRAGAK